MIISIIAAIANNNVIGKKNALPWYLPADLKHFKDITMGHHIIMGQKTHKSIGKALPGRTNIILSDDPKYKAEGCVVVDSLEKAFDVAKKNNETEAFITGGASVYKQTIDLADKLYITKVHADVDGDIYFPQFNKDNWQMISCEKHVSDDKNPYPYEFCMYERKK